ncbi:hypothetical protein Aduo_002337 [Ancylostoma duodenale]
MSTQGGLATWHQETLVVLERFRDVWHWGYLLALTEKHQSRIGQDRSTPLVSRAGHLVITADDSLPRGRWPLAIIVKVQSDTIDTVRRPPFEPPEGKPSGLLTISTKSALLKVRKRLNLVVPPYLNLALSHQGPRKLLFFQEMQFLKKNCGNLILLT